MQKRASLSIVVEKFIIASSVLKIEISIVQALPDIAEQASAVSAAATEAAAAEAAAAETAAGEGREPGASGNL